MQLSTDRTQMEVQCFMALEAAPKVAVAQELTAICIVLVYYLATTAPVDWHLHLSIMWTSINSHRKKDEALNSTYVSHQHLAAVKYQHQYAQPWYH